MARVNAPSRTDVTIPAQAGIQPGEELPWIPGQARNGNGRLYRYGFLLSQEWCWEVVPVWIPAFAGMVLGGCTGMDSCFRRNGVGRLYRYGFPSLETGIEMPHQAAQDVFG